jgi:hypothetical protein
MNALIRAAALVMLSATSAEAKVLAKGPTGFLVEYTVELKADAKTATDAFVDIGAWWGASHTYSGDSKNLAIGLKPGGCWCETLPDGRFVQHMAVVNTAPGMLVFSGGLGPLQFMGVSGSLHVTFKETAGKTKVTMRYDVGGRDDKNFEGISKGVDAVLAEQFARYANFVTTGKPELK